MTHHQIECLSLLGELKSPNRSSLETRPACTLRLDNSTSCADLDEETHFAANVASRVMTTLISKYESLSSRARKSPGYKDTEEDAAQ
jgi:hypothetical protein